MKVKNTKPNSQFPLPFTSHHFGLRSPHRKVTLANPSVDSCSAVCDHEIELNDFAISNEL